MILHSPLIFAVFAATTVPALTDVERDEEFELSRDVENTDTIKGNLERQRELEGIFDDWRVPPWLESARNARDGLLEQIRLDIGASYHVAGLAAYGGLEDVSGFSGDLTVEGTWNLFGRKINRPFDLRFRLRDRQRIAARAASEVAGDSGGLLWNLTAGFSDAGFEVPDFRFVQHFPDQHIDITAGQMTFDSMFDRHGLRSAKRAFMNRAFSKNPAAAFPRFGTGAAMIWDPECGFDFGIGACSVQGTQNGDQVDFDFGSNDLFKAIQFGHDFELGGNPARIQAMLWHADPVEHAGEPEGQGLSLAFEHWLASTNNRIFARLAAAAGAASDADRFMAAGFAMERRQKDLWGLALGAGRDSAGSGNWQYVVESFYRWQIGPHVSLTPSVQVVFGDGLQPNDPKEEKSYRLVAGIRGSVTF
jgi:hypothetical protein